MWAILTVFLSRASSNRESDVGHSDKQTPIALSCPFLFTHTACYGHVAILIEGESSAIAAVMCLFLVEVESSRTLRQAMRWTEPRCSKNWFASLWQTPVPLVHVHMVMAIFLLGQGGGGVWCVVCTVYMAGGRRDCGWLLVWSVIDFSLNFSRRFAVLIICIACTCLLCNPGLSGLLLVCVCVCVCVCV